MIPDYLVKKFQWAVKEDYGEELKFEDAAEILTGLTSLFDLLAKLYHRIQTDDPDGGTQSGLSDKESQTKEESEQIEKIKPAETGEPITLSGYAVDKDGNDTGKRFVRKEDAEEYTRMLHQ